ncbi:MAG: SDR family NAD(P)-dependent oxidoreductase, partial [Sphingomonas sp.]
MKVLENRIAIVTGGGQGVGQGVARAVAAAGAHVVIAPRHLEQAVTEAAFLRDPHGVVGAGRRR